MSERRDFKKIIGVVFLSVLLCLVFFSKTIYNHNLPVVTAVRPHNGRLNKTETSSGVASWTHVENLYAAVAGRVEEVLVSEGDTVAEGQELYRLSFDRDEAERKLKEIQNSRARIQLDIQNLNIRLSRQQRYQQDLVSQEYEEEHVSTYELDALLLDIRQAQRDLRELRDNDANDEDLRRARSALQKLYLRQDDLERRLADQEKKAGQSYEDSLKNQESKLLDYDDDIASLNLDLQAKNIELSNLALQEETYLKTLETFDMWAAVLSPADGAVVSLNVSKGESIRADQLIATVGTAGSFELECAVSLENNFVLPGDVAELSNSSHTVRGTVAALNPTAQNKLVTILIESGDITAGETFDVTFRKNSATTYTLIPNGALNQDNNGYFVNLVKRRGGIMGNEYYLERLDVYIGDSDSQNTAIVRGITFFEPIAQISDKPITEGDVITLANESDFFER